MTLGRRRRPQRDDSDRRTLDEAVAALRNCQRAGITSVAVADALKMLGAGPETAPAPPARLLDPQVDPVTGCKSVTPARP